MMITDTFNKVVQEAIAALQPAPPKGQVYTYDELQACLSDENGAAMKRYADDIVGVIKAIQGLRETNAGLDMYLRDHGIITRVRTVRP